MDGRYVRPNPKRPVTIQWKSDCPAERIHDLDHLLGWVTEIDAETSEDAAVGIILCHDSGAEITAYVSQGRWWLMWTPEDYAEHAVGSYHSIADSAPTSPPGFTDLLACCLCGHHGEVDLREAVDAQSARAAISQFYTSPERHGALTWTPD